MSQDIGSITINETLQVVERTWRTTMETPDGVDPANYMVTVHRHVVLRNQSGETERVINDPVECLRYSPNFKPTRTFTAAEAEVHMPGVTASNRDGIDAVVVAQKLAEQAEEG